MREPLGFRPAVIGFLSVAWFDTWLGWAALCARAVLERAIPSAARGIPVAPPT